MDFSASAVRKNVATTFKRLTQLVIAIAVLFSVLNLYFYFSIPKEKQLSYKQALDISQKRNADTLKKAASLEDTDDIKLASRIYAYVLCEAIGEVCGADMVTSQANFNNSIAGNVSKLFLFPLNNPPSSSMYVASKLIEKAGFIPPSYAADPLSNTRGIGFASIEYISTIWLGLRNLAYVVIALIMISIGFMIMFRMKLGSQAVIAIENSIPRIIIALITITFSFAIAGLLIDLMYVAIIIIADVFGAMNIGDLTPEVITERYMFAGPSEIIAFIFRFGLGNIFWHLPGAIVGVLGTGISVILQLIGSALAWFFVINKFASYASKTVSPGMNVSAGASFVGTINGGVNFPNLIDGLLHGSLNAIFIASLGLFFGFLVLKAILGLIIIFTALQLGFKIFAIVMSSYIRILLLIIFSPLLLLVEAFPGKSMFTSWLRNLFAEIATFPIIITLFLVASLLIKSTFAIDACQGSILVNDPDCAIGAFPFLWGFDATSFSILVAFGFLFLTPHYVDTLKKALNPNAMDLAPNAGVGMFFGSVSGIGKAGLGSFTGGLTRQASRNAAGYVGDTLSARLGDDSTVGKFVKHTFGTNDKKGSTQQS